MENSEKKVIIFDIDMTLAESKAPIDTEMADLLTTLAKTKKVAVISGGSFKLFEDQLLSNLSMTNDELSNLYLLPTSGSTLYRYDGEWKVVYEKKLSPNERKKIIGALDGILLEAGITLPERVYGEQIEDRGTQITFSALGQLAPLHEKQKWDPDKLKRTRMQKIMAGKLPEFEVGMGGSTSIDITKKGVDKAYGIVQLERYLKIPIAEMLYVGDQLEVGGNDHPVIKTGVDWIDVKSIEETKSIIREMLGE